jgi:polyisoprenoid-binding protein YceI
MTATNTIQEAGISVWSLDPAHSAVHFKVRHMAIAWVRGDFRISKGTLRWNRDKTTESSIEADIDSASVNSGEPTRDAHLRNAEFFDVERFPSIQFRSTKIARSSNDAAIVSGDLTMHGVTRPVELTVTDISPEIEESAGHMRFAASANATISRKEFGLTWNKALETGGVLVGDQIIIELDIEFVRPVNS